MYYFDVLKLILAKKGFCADKQHEDDGEEEQEEARSENEEEDSSKSSNFNFFNKLFP